MLVPTTLGAIVGILGFVPLALSLKVAKNVTPTSNLGYGSVTILGVLVSLAVLAISVLICYFFARDYLVPFALACAITLSLSAFAYGIYSVVKQNKASKERVNKKESK